MSLSVARFSRIGRMDSGTGKLTPDSGESGYGNVVLNHSADVAILGAGFGGSLMALVLQRIGLRPVLIDRGTHPRFAIGESSTPIANLALGNLARRYDLPRIEPLAKYGSWKAA